MGTENPFTRLTIITSTTSTTSTTRSTRIKKAPLQVHFFYPYISQRSGPTAAVLLKEREMYIAIFALFYEVGMLTEIVLLGVFQHKVSPFLQ